MGSGGSKAREKLSLICLVFPIAKVGHRKVRVKSVRKGSTEEYVGEPKGGKEKRKKKQSYLEKFVQIRCVGWIWIYDFNRRDMCGQ